jgi:hypothetical protein
MILPGRWPRPGLGGTDSDVGSLLSGYRTSHGSAGILPWPESPSPNLKERDETEVGETGGWPGWV